MESSGQTSARNGWFRHVSTLPRVRAELRAAFSRPLIELAERPVERARSVARRVAREHPIERPATLELARWLQLECHSRFLTDTGILAAFGRRTHPRTGTHVARRGRKATGLLQSAGSPNGVASYVFLERIPLDRRPTGQPPSPVTFPPPAQPARLAGNDPDHPARARPAQRAGAGRGELRLADRGRRGGRQRPARGDWPELPRAHLDPVHLGWLGEWPADRSGDL